MEVSENRWGRHGPVGAALALVVFLPSCASKQPVAVPPTSPESSTTLEDIEGLVRIGCYQCLQDAYRLLRERRASNRDGIGQALVEIALMLALRERELGILDSVHDSEVEALLPETSSTDLSLYGRVVEAISPNAGFVTDNTEDVIRRLRVLWEIQNSKSTMRVLRDDSLAGVVAGYAYLSLLCSPGSFRGEDLDSEVFRVTAAHADALAIQFKAATCRRDDRERLEHVLAVEPRYREVDYFLGRDDLRRRDRLSARDRLLRVRESFPSAVAVRLAIANLELELGDVEDALHDFEKILPQAPEHRDALPGKAKCLSYLGRHAEAIDVLRDIISLGSVYLGEANYWLAWNEHRIVQLEIAAAHAEDAKKYLPMDTNVSALSGIIAFEQNQLTRAEAALLEARELDESNCDAAFYLGKVYAGWRRGEATGSYFEQAALCYGDQETGLREEIDELGKSSAAQKRVALLLRRRENQRRKADLSKATSFYNAAGWYYSAGHTERALSCAGEAAKHELLAEKARDLILTMETTPLLW